MRKKWLILSLVILIAQTLTPLVALAEVMGQEIGVRGIELVSLELLESDELESNNVKLLLTVADPTPGEGEHRIHLEGFTLSSSEKESILNEEGTVIGWMKQDESSVSVYAEEAITGIQNIELDGVLKDTTHATQTIGVSYEEQHLTQTVKLKDTQESEVADTEDTKSSDETMEESEEEDRSPKNIEELNHYTSFFTQVNLEKKSDGDGGFIQIDGKNTPVIINDEIKINMDWELSEALRKEMKSGDYYNSQLPPELKISTVIHTTLESEGIVYGDLTIDTDGKIEIIFNE